MGQSCLLPDMFFAWDARLERVTSEAVRSYYRDRYQLDEGDLTEVRALYGLLRRAGLVRVTARTVLIERVHPLPPAAHDYIAQTIFRDTWGERLQPYLQPDDCRQLRELCDPDSAAFALRRPDFHFLQTFTVVTADL